MTIADIKKDPELMTHIMEDLENFDDSTEVIFEAWAIGYDKEGQVVDSSICLVNGPDPKEVVETSKKLTLDNVPTTVEGDSVVLEVETVARVAEDEFLNLGTIYQKEL